MFKQLKQAVVLGLAVAGCASAFTGCMTPTQYVPEGAAVSAVAAFSQDDIVYTVSVAVQSMLAQGCLNTTDGSRKVLVVKDVVNDTHSLGSSADQLADGVSVALRENLTNSGKVVVFNPQVAQYATVRVEPQMALFGRLTQRNLRQDNGDYQVEYSLNLQLVDLATGLEFWQKRTPLRKIADRVNL